MQTLDARFARAMAAMAPFEPRPLLAVAVSGGADSLTLALLADHWVRPRGGSVLGLVVDHGLRPESSAEAAATIARLAARGIEARLLPVAGLRPGPAVAERARAARYRILREACAAAGCLHLLLGHHQADQAETLMIRVLGSSGSAGLAAMPALRELQSVRLLRPLLGVSPGLLRDYLRAEGLAWIEDPSNRDPRALRARLRARGTSGETALAVAAAAAGRARAAAEQAAANVLARRARVRPEGFAVLTPGRILPAALEALVQTIAGAEFPPAAARLAALAACPAAATLAGVRLLPAGRLGPGWLLVREPRAMAPPVPAVAGAVWDGRFRLTGATPAGTTIGALGPEAARFHRHAGLPRAVLCTLPAVRDGNFLVAVPHLGYPDASTCARVTLRFCPPRPMAGAPFCPPDPE